MTLTQRVRGKGEDMGKAPSIILIEDEEQQREVLQMVFESHGYVTRIAASAEEALRQLDEGAPDVIVSDVKLPGIDGFTLCENLRTRAGFETIPFVFITGYNDPKAIERVKTLGSVGYVTKPYDIDTLIDVVKQYAPLMEG